jgi:hypothetical protein
VTAVVDGTTRGLLFSQTSFALRGSSVRTKVTPTDRTQNQQSQDYNAGFYVAVHSRGYTTFYRGAHLHSGCSFVVNTHMQPKGGTVWGVYSTAQRARLHRGTEYSGGPQGAGSIDPGDAVPHTRSLPAASAHCLLVVRRVAVVLGVGASRPLQPEAALQVLVRAPSHQ